VGGTRGAGRSRKNSSLAGTALKPLMGFEDGEVTSSEGFVCRLGLVKEANFDDNAAIVAFTENLHEMKRNW